MKRTFAFTIATALAGMLVGSVDSFAAKGGIPGPPGGETVAQNLSVPGILVGQLGTLVCGTSAEAPTGLLPPTGTPLTGYELDPAAYYWVQKVHVWQAQCFHADTASVYGNWGDNLEGGDAKLTTGAPIRVEIVLTNSADFSATIPPLPDYTVSTLEGYNVVKLEPSLEDRVSAWGHLAGVDSEGAWVAFPFNFPQASWVVHDAGMQIEIFNTDTLADAVPLQAIAPEINASGKIVYGYNLRVTEAGTYTIHFIAPNVTFTGCDAGDCVAGESS